MNNSIPTFITAENFKKALSILKERRLIFVTAEPVIEADYVADSLAQALLRRTSSQTLQILVAPRYARPQDLGDAQDKVILFRDISNIGRFDLADFLWSPEPLQKLIAANNYVVITLSNEAFHWLHDYSRLGGWEAVGNAVLSLDPQTCYDPDGLGRWFSERIDWARHNRIISPRQKKFLANSHVISAIVGQLRTPVLLDVFIREFAASLDMEDPDFEEYLEDLLYDVRNPQGHFAEWYCQQERSTQAFLQTLVFLAGTDQGLVWQAYQDMVMGLRKFIPDLVCDPIGLLAQRTSNVVSPNDSIDFVPTFSDPVYRTIIDHSYEHLVEVTPYFQQLTFDLPDEIDDAAAHRVRKSIAYITAMLGKSPAQVRPVFLRWAENPNPSLKASAAFGLTVFQNINEGCEEQLLTWIDELRESTEPHVRSSAVQLAFSLGKISPQKSVQILASLAHQESNLDNLKQIIIAASRLSRLAYDECMGILLTVVSKPVDQSELTVVTVEQLEQILSEEKELARMLRDMKLWAKNFNSSVRWTCATFMLRNTHIFSLEDVTSVVAIAYEYESGAQQATVELIKDPAPRDEVFPVLREVIRLGRAEPVASVATVLVLSAGAIPAELREILRLWSQDADARVRKYVPLLLDRLVGVHEADQAPSPAPFSSADELFEHIHQLGTDPDYDVRRALVEALPAFARHDPPRFYQTISAFEADADERIRTAALEALYACKELDPAQATDSAQVFFQDKEENVRLQALKVVSAFASNRAAEVLDTIAGLVTDPSPTVKRALLGTIGEAAQHQPVEAINLLARLVQDPTVHNEAVPPFIQIAAGNSSQALDSIKTFLAGPDKALKLASIAVLAEFPPAEYSLVVEVAESALHDRDTHIKEAIIDLLARTAPQVPQPSAKLLAELALDSSVSRQAEAVLARTLAAHFDQAKDSLVGLAEEKRLDARLIAARIALGLSEEMPVKTTPVLKVLAKGRESEVLKLVLSASALAGNVRPREVLQILAAINYSERNGLVQDATTLTEKICTDNQTQVLLELKQMLRNPNPVVRNLAMKGLGRLIPGRTVQVIRTLEEALPAETTLANKREGLRILDKASHLRLVDSAVVMANLCEDDEAGEEARNLFTAATRLTYHPGQNLLRSMASGRKWRMNELSDSLTRLQFLKFVLFSVRSEIQK